LPSAARPGQIPETLLEKITKAEKGWGRGSSGRAAAQQAQGKVQTPVLQPPEKKTQKAQTLLLKNNFQKHTPSMNANGHTYSASPQTEKYNVTRTPKPGHKSDHPQVAHMLASLPTFEFNFKANKKIPAAVSSLVPGFFALHRVCVCASVAEGSPTIPCPAPLHQGWPPTLSPSMARIGSDLQLLQRAL
jgi:hypothetical protein